MIRSAALLAVFALSSCATGPGLSRGVDDPAVQNLLALPVPDYFATLSVAADVARNCDRYRYDAELDSALNALRNANGTGSVAAASQRTAIVMETDVRQRSFLAKHALASVNTDLCPAGDAEMLENSAISAMLVPL